MNEPVDHRTVSTPPSDLIGRAFVLVLIIGAAGWLAYAHLGWPLQWSGPAFVTGIAAIKSVDWLLGKEALEGLRASMRQWLKRHLTWRVLLVPAVMLVVLSAFVTTVAVDTNASESRTVRVEPALRALNGSDGVSRFVVFTMPWGSNVVVKADGYADSVVRAYPVVPRRVMPGNDLRQVPSILFRPGAGGLMALGSGGILRVWAVLEGGHREIVARDTTGSQTSFVLGPARPIPDSMTDRWRSELSPEISPPNVASLLRAWQSPSPLTMQREFPTGVRLVAEIVVDEAVLYRAEVQATQARLIDVPMLDNLSNPGGVP